MDHLFNETGTGDLPTLPIGTTIPSVMAAAGGSLLKFREDGLREPPSITTPTNLTIMIVGLSILIIPVILVVVCLCAKAKIFERLRVLKFSNDNNGDDENCDGSKLPYTQFDNSKPKNLSLKISSDIRVLIDKDNMTPGSPKHNDTPKIENKVLMKSSESSIMLAEEFNSADATFVVSRSRSGQFSPATLNLDS